MLATITLCRHEIPTTRAPHSLGKLPFLGYGFALARENTAVVVYGRSSSGKFCCSGLGSHSLVQVGFSGNKDDPRCELLGVRIIAYDIYENSAYT